MLTAAVIAVGTLLYGTLIGYVTHWVLHQSWAGRVYRAHMSHHLRQYPPRDLMSTTYRSAGKDDGLRAFTPVLAGGIGLWLLALWLLGVPWWAVALVVIESAAVGWLHDYVHDGFHLEGFWMTRFAWFRNLRSLHWLHHWNMRKNLGILWFGWDRVFRTFRETHRRPSNGRSA